MKQRAGGLGWGRAGVRVGCALGLLASVSSAQQPPVEVPPEAPPSEPAQPPGPPPVLVPLSDELWAELDDYVRSARGAFDVPGAAVALIQNGQVEHVGTYGVLGVDHPVSVDERTRFMIGSVTKSMTTTLAATLVSEGQLDWDDAVVQYLPTFALSNAAWTPLVRIRDVLGHTSGLPRSDLSLFVDFHRPLGLIESLADIPAVAAPGERFEYQNQVFAAGGFALARAAGAKNRNGDIARTYDHLMRRRVFQPLGMARTTLDFEAAIRDDNHASPHALDAASSSVTSFPIGFERFVLPAAPAGAVWASISDMARYLAMHVLEGESVDGVRVVPAAELLETHTAQTVLAGGTGYGLGWGVSEGASGPVLEHGGGTAGFNAMVLGLPSLDFGFVILTNRAGGGLFISAVTRYIAELAFARPHQGDADLLAADAEQKAVLAQLAAALAPVDARAVDGYLGRYERELTVSFAAEQLVIDTAYGTLHFKTIPGFEGLFLSTDNHLLGLGASFSTDEQGNVTLSLSRSFEDGVLIDPLVAARLGDTVPHDPVTHHRADDEQSAFDWRTLSNARRWINSRDPINLDRRVWGPAPQ